jgi:hypothetical protein
LIGFNNTPVRDNNGKITEETFELEVIVETYRERMQFDIIKTSIYDAIFGLLWLEEYKSNIVYKAKTIQFNKCGCNLEISVIEIFPVSLAAMAAYQRKDSNLVLFALMTVPAKELKAVEILLEYRGFEYLFEEVKGKKALPEHRLWDYKIFIIDDKALEV